MSDFTQKYLDKEAVNIIPEVLPPDYDEWIDTLVPDELLLDCHEEYEF